MKIRKSIGEKVWDTVIVLFFILFSIITIYPFWHELCLSLSSSAQAKTGGLFLYPRNFSINAYIVVFTSNYLSVAFKNSIFITVIGVILSLLVSASGAYMLSKKQLWGNKFLLGALVFTILFNGGLIPTYLVVKYTGFYDSLWALIILASVAPFNVIIIRNFFMGMPESIEESALIDGAGPFTIFFKIVLPLSKPVLATVALWVAVYQWNDYMRGLIYLTDRKNYILPVLIRDIIVGASDLANIEANSLATSETITAATIIVVMFPILCVYPFLQKHFTKGIMLGAVKG